jgi:hypothetical protein
MSSQASLSLSAELKKKRNRNTLGTTAHQRRYAEESQKKAYYLDVRSLNLSLATFKSNFLKAFNANRASHGLPMIDLTNGFMKTFTNLHLDHEYDRVNNAEENWCNGGGSELGPGAASLRRSTIAYIFKTIFDSQPEDQWTESGLVGKIMKRIGIPEGSRPAVKNVLKDVLEAERQGVRYDPNTKLSSRGRKRKIDDSLPEAGVIYRAVQSGMSVLNATVLVNKIRARNSEEPVSSHAVQGFIQTSPLIIRNSRQHKKSGKDDEGTVWAIARLAEATQWLKQLELGAEEYHDPLDPRIAQMELKPIWPHAIVYWDEHHRKTILGHVSKIESRVAVDGNGKPTHPDKGGIFPKPMPQTMNS